jgi:lambda family phage tail tape measure protein
MAITIGELVAKLRIDYEDFTKGQRKLVRGAETATKNIEQHYEDLGIHSSRHLDLMRVKAQRNFDAIANSAERNFNDIVRAHKAMMAQLATIDKMQYGPKSAGTAQLQQAYKTLGVRPATEIEAQKRQLQEAYKMAAGTAGYDTAEILRLEQVKNAGIAKLDQELRAQQIASQKQVAAATQAATKDMADAYKTLGLHSAAEFDAMRQKILDANKAVVADAKGNQTAIVKANEATAAKLAKVDEMQFGKQVSLQEQMAAVAQKKAADIAKAYKTLGMRSAEEFNAMRKNAISAYDTIAQHAMHQAQTGAISAKQATQTILEAEKQKNAQIAQMDEMQYGKRISASERMAQQMATNFQTLGIRSSVAIEEERQRIEKAYNDIARNANSTKDEILRAEKSKTAAMKRLHAEQWGSQNDLFSRIKSGAAMVLGHAVTQFTLMAMAVHAILSSIVRGITAMFRTSFQAMADYEIAVASLAAMVVTFTEKPAGKTQAEYWQDAVRYAEGMIPVLENIAAKTLMTGEQVTALANAFARVGVFLDPGNAPQMEAFTVLANALPILTRGQEIMKQINTEIRALTQGTNMATSMLLTTLHALDPMVKKHIIQWREQNTVLENIGRMLSGFIPASELLANQWQAIKNALTTIWKQTLRGGMLGTYKEIIAATKELTEWVRQHREQISQGLAVAWAAMLKTVQLVVEVFKPFVHLASLHLTQLVEMGKLYVYIITLLKQGVQVMGHLMIAVVNIYRTMIEISKLLMYTATGQWGKLKEQLGRIANAAKGVGSEAKKAFDAATPSAWVGAVKEASDATKTLEMDVAKAYQEIGKGALGVRDALMQAAGAFEFALPSDVDYQILGAKNTFEKAQKELEGIITSSTANLKALETAWASGSRDAMQAVLSSMYDEVTWAESEIEEALKNAMEAQGELLANAMKDREGLYLAFSKKMKDLHSKSLFGQAASILGYISPADLKAQEEQIRWAYDYIVKSVEAQLKEARAKLLELESEYRIQALNVLSSNIGQTDAALDELAATIEILSVEIEEAHQQAKKAQKARNTALDKLYGRDKKGGGGKSEAEKAREEWERTAAVLSKDIRYFGLDNTERDLMEIADRVKELQAMPKADFNLIKEWKSVKTTEVWIKEAEANKDILDPHIQKREGMIEADKRAYEILADMAEEARWKEIEGLADTGKAYEEFRKATTQEEKERIHEMILLSGAWQDGLRLGLHDFAQYAGEVGWQVYDTVDMAFRNMADAVAEFAVSGKADFNDLANSIIKDLIRIYYQAAVLKPLAESMEKSNWLGAAIDALGGMLSFGGGSSAPSIDVGFQTGAPALFGPMAKGGTIPSSNLTNTILTKPTLIPFAAGGVLAGEAGEEAVMPLTRVNGRLGVEATGLGGTGELKVELINRTGQNMKMSQGQQRMDGKQLIVPIFLDALESNYMGLREVLGG